MKKSSPSFSFFVSGLDGEVEIKSPVWQEPLPSGLSSEELKKVGYPSYGDYFEAVSGFVAADNFSAFGPFSGHISNIAIHLEKHGALYHPGRICVEYEYSCPRNFVVNLAVDEFPRKMALQEFEVLKNMKAIDAGGRLPEVFRAGEITTSSGALLAMFIGEWLDSYHEFHLSGATGRVVVWDPAGYFFLDDIQSRELYRAASEILTSFYDPENFTQIYPWHHAAGDFILNRSESGAIDLKLITVRQYASLFNFEEKNFGNSVIGLFYFLVNLSIRMRIDRFDGIGEYVWADDFVLESTVRGFVDAISSMKIHGIGCMEAMAAGFSEMTESDLFEMSDEIVLACNPASPEIPLIRKKLVHHVERMHILLSGYF